MSTLHPFRKPIASRLPFIVALLACPPATADLASASGGEEWEQVHKLVADNSAANLRFGEAVSTDGSTVVVGASHGFGSNHGRVYVFDATTGGQLHELYPVDSLRSAAVGSSVIVVGIGPDDEMGSHGGAAIVYDAVTYEPLQFLTADVWLSAEFGWSVAVSGNTIAVGAIFADDAAPDSGSAFVFDAMTGEQLHKLTADDGAADDHLGRSVSIDGNVIVVGASGDDGGAGSAYVFDAATGQQLHKLIADDAASEDGFGYSVSVSGETIGVGAPFDDDAASASGAIYVFDAATGQQLHKLTANDGAADDWFGYSVSMSGDIVVAGACQDDDSGSDSGSAYVFDAGTGVQLQKLTADDGAAEDYFAHSVSISGITMVAGAYGDDDAGSKSGSAYVFRESAPPCPADLNNDLMVDTSDILVVLDAWGTCDDCLEDINDDGVVDIDDVFEVLANWGPCPEEL